MLDLKTPRAALILSRLAQAGWLVRIGRARYVALDPRWVIATRSRRPLDRYKALPFFPVLATSIAGVLQLFGGRLRSLALFGSCARLTYSPESDVDLLLVVEPLPISWADRLAEVRPVSRECLRMAGGGHADRREFHAPQFVLMTPHEVEGEPPLLLDLTEDADVLLDPEKTLTGALQRLRGKLRKHGAQRVFPLNGPPYWRLQPGARLGEVAEL